MTSQIDEITREVIRHKLDMIAEEMQTRKLRAAFSSVIKEAEDASSAIFDRHGNLVAQAVANPGQIGLLTPGLESILEEFPVDTMREGDVYALNDPFDGGSHLPDITVIRPIFNDGEVIAFGASYCHHQDMGGKISGSAPTDATEIYQEGFRFPPLKLYENDEPNELFLEILRRNVRVPRLVIGDLKAQYSAVITAEERITDFVEEYGNEGFLEAMRQLVDHAEQLVRLDIERIPDGSYSFYDFIDDDGIDRNTPIRIEVTVEVRGDEVFLDFTGTSSQTLGPMNCVASTTRAMVYYTINAIAETDLPTNSGCFKPVSMHLPEGSIVNPSPPVAVNARYLTFKRVVDVVFGAFSKAVPDRIPAAGSGQLNNLYFGGTDDSGEQWVYGEFTAGGSGGFPTQDGIDVIETDLSNTKNTPVEATELEFPIRILKYQLLPDSCGHGQYRGGLGCLKIYEILDGPLSFTHRRDRHNFQPWGIQGGTAAPRCKTLVTFPDEEPESYPSKFVTELEAGTIIENYCTGGAGYGDPIERDFDAIERDIEDEKLSPSTAEEAYHVVLGPDGSIDREASREKQLDFQTDDPPAHVDRGELPEYAQSD